MIDGFISDIFDPLLSSPFILISFLLFPFSFAIRSLHFNSAVYLRLLDECLILTPCSNYHTRHPYTIPLIMIEKRGSSKTSATRDSEASHVAAQDTPLMASQGLGQGQGIRGFRDGVASAGTPYRIAVGTYEPTGMSSIFTMMQRCSLIL